MVVSTFAFTTGPATLLDVGTLSYNGCTFSPLFATTVSGKVVKDAANRTTKEMEYALEAEGYVTTPTKAGVDISAQVANLRSMLTAQGGQLIYQGRGFNLSVNGAGAAFDNAARDVSWGPVPELLEFQPLGSGLSAKVKWRVVTRVVEVSRQAGAAGHLPQKQSPPLLQFNYETAVAYGEDYYSTLTVKGTMEIPLTRSGQGNRSVTSTVDDARSELDSRIFRGIDLSRFFVVRRNYQVSRDKRTLEFDVAVEEKLYMDTPPGCSVARGTYSVRPAKAGMGLVSWLCTLRCTYTVRKDESRRLAWVSFLALLRLRMSWAAAGIVPPTFGNNSGAVAGQAAVAAVQGGAAAAASFLGPLASIPGVNLLLPTVGVAAANAVAPVSAPQPARQQGPPAWIVDFSVEEGVYKDSKTTTFSATWRLVTTFNRILVASGLWRKLKEVASANVPNSPTNNLWAISMADVSGSSSWLQNRLDPGQDVIVDFGGG